MVVELTASRSYPGGVAGAFDAVLPAPLPYVFARRYLAIPAIREVRGPEGPDGSDSTETWGTVGQTRTIVLADGGTLLETLTEVDRPQTFGYRISDVTGPMRALVSHLDGRWTFESAGNGVQITWSWLLHPRGRVGEAAMPVFIRMWRGYARQALEQIEPLLAH